MFFAGDPAALAEVVAAAQDPAVPMHFALCADRRSDGQWSLNVMAIPLEGGSFANAPLGLVPGDDVVGGKPLMALVTAFALLCQQEEGDQVLSW